MRSRRNWAGSSQQGRRAADPIPPEHFCGRPTSPSSRMARRPPTAARRSSHCHDVHARRRSKWSAEYTKPLVGKTVRILVDNDTKGATHGKVVSSALAQHVSEVKVISYRPASQGRSVGLDRGRWDPRPTQRDRRKDGGCEGATARVPSPDAPPPNPTLKSNVVSLRAASPGAALVPPPNATSLADATAQRYGQCGPADLIPRRRAALLPAIRKWLVWDGRRWAVDDKGAIRERPSRRCWSA